MSSNWTFNARLDRVVDGDTYVMLIDLGFRTYGYHAIRLADVDAPELRTVEGELAKLWATAWFSYHCHGRDPADWPYVLATKRIKTSFNRYVGTIVCSQGHSLADDVTVAVAAHNWVLLTQPPPTTTQPISSP